MTDSDQLREQMWDLVYGLLSSEESRPLITRIKSDPQAARLYAEVRLQADLVGYASRIEDASFVLEAPGAAAKPTPAKLHKAAAGAPAGGAGTRLRSGRWMVGAAATALAVLLAVGHFWPRPNEQQIASRFIVTDIEAPASINAGLTNKFALRTYPLNVAGQPTDGVPATVDLTMRGRSGETLLQRQVVTNESGRSTVEVPGSALEPGVRLEIGPTQGKYSDSAKSELAEAVAPTSKESLEETSLGVELPVRQEPQMTYFLLEQPVAEAGKPMNFACWSFSSFSGKPASEEASRAAIENFAGAALTVPQENAKRDFNVVSGVLQAPPGAVPDAGALAYQFGADAKRQAAGRAVVSQRGAGGAAAGAAPADVRLRQSLNEPLAEAAKPAAAAPAKESLPSISKLAAENGQRAPGQAGGESLLRGTQPLTPVIPAGEQIAIQVPDDLAGKPVVAEAISRGITVTTVPVAEGGQKSALGGFGANAKNASQSVTLNVPLEADGRIDVALVDQSVAPPQVVHQQSFYREPSRKLQIALPNIKDRFAPGESVQLLLQVTDETGQPAADTLVGVRLWNEAVVKHTAEQPVLLETVVREGTGGAVIPLDQVGEEKGAKLADLRRDEQATVTPGQEISAPIRVSNLAAVQVKFETALAAAQRQRQTIVQSIGGIVVVGGLLLAVALGLLTMLRMANGAQVTVPALAVAAASLLVGLGWVGWFSPMGQPQIAMTPGATFSDKSAESPAAVADADAKLSQLAQGQPAPAAAGYAPAAPVEELGLAKDKKLAIERGGATAGGLGAAGGAAEGKARAEQERLLADDITARSLGRQAPAALYFNPQLLTDAGGQVTISFVMPPVDSEYRLLIDALGHGRIGSKQQLIIGRAADGK